MFHTHMKQLIQIFRVLVLTSFVSTALAQNISILDPGLDAAIRDALQIPSGPLTEQDILSLTVLDAGGRHITNIQGLEAAVNLVAVDLRSNDLATVSVPSQLTNLATLDLSFNSITNCFIPGGLTNFAKLILDGNQLSDLTLPPDLSGLADLELQNNQFRNLSLPPGLIGLNLLDLSSNQLTSLTLPADITQLTTLNLDGNPLRTLLLSEPLAASLADTLTSLEGRGVSVVTFPLAILLSSPSLTTPQSFEFTLTGPPGVYTILASGDLGAVGTDTNKAVWTEIGTATNILGSVVFTDAEFILPDQRFYRARQ
jgi:hypothetical protein